VGGNDGAGDHCLARTRWGDEYPKIIAGERIGGLALIFGKGGCEPEPER
jgi:hypothetical protein